MRTVQDYLTGSAPTCWCGVPLGERAADVLRAAARRARVHQHDEVGTCHLLWALTDAEEKAKEAGKTAGRGFMALTRLDITAKLVDEKIGQLEDFYDGTPDCGVFEDDPTDYGIDYRGIAVSRRVQEVIENAQEAAYDYGRRRTMPIDLLLTVTKGYTGSTSDRIFDALGVPVTFVHNQVIRARSEPREYEIERRTRHIDDMLSS